ncbi:MAG: hypothetical protein JWM27_72 [Gemmatimonadetes bacterium]|nr:hypothetical protein [Gemmatimonadota bacterium]
MSAARGVPVPLADGLDQYSRLDGVETDFMVAPTLAWVRACRAVEPANPSLYAFEALLGAVVAGWNALYPLIHAACREPTDGERRTASVGSEWASDPERWLGDFVGQRIVRGFHLVTNACLAQQEFPFRHRRLHALRMSAEADPSTELDGPLWALAMDLYLMRAATAGSEGGIGAVARECLNDRLDLPTWLEEVSDLGWATDCAAHPLLHVAVRNDAAQAVLQRLADRMSAEGGI